MGAEAGAWLTDTNVPIFYISRPILDMVLDHLSDVSRVWHSRIFIKEYVQNEILIEHFSTMMARYMLNGDPYFRKSEAFRFCGTEKYCIYHIYVKS